MQPRFNWDEPKGCTSPRGWCILANHPDKPSSHCLSCCVGNYLDYAGTSSKGPNGETIHATAYISRGNGLGSTIPTYGLGYCWFHTIDEARAFIESNVCAYFGKTRAAA